VFSFIKSFSNFSYKKPWSLSLLSQNKCPKYHGGLILD